MVKESRFEEEKDDKYLKELNPKLDNLVRESIDKRRIRKTDDSRKFSVIESVFDERTIFQLEKLIKQGIIEDFQGIISSGKEANVYLAYNQNGEELAVKIYKIDRNTSKWMMNYIHGDPRFKKIPKNISKIIYLWASKEYKNLKRAYKVGLSVPKPIHVRNNILIMEYIGFGSIPAPKLKNIINPKSIFTLSENILNFIKVLYQDADLVHGDLSEFNILYHNQHPVIIDVSQAVSTQHPKAEVFLVRDIKNIYQYFENFDIKLPNPESFYYEVIDI